MRRDKKYMNIRVFLVDCTIKNKINIIINSCKSSDFKRFSHTHSLFYTVMCVILGLSIHLHQLKMSDWMVERGENNKSSTVWYLNPWTRTYNTIESEEPLFSVIKKHHFSNSIISSAMGSFKDQKWDLLIFSALSQIEAD